MKVLFVTYPMAFHTPGGGEMQLLAYKDYLEKNEDITVDLFNPWKPDFYEYDLVHFFSVVGGSSHFCNFIKGLGIPLVISSSLWVTERTQFDYPMEEIVFQLELSDRIIANSEMECDQLSSLTGIARKRFSTVYNGVSESFINNSKKGFSEKFSIESPFILNVGNIEPRKNQLRLIEAAKKHPSLKVCLVGHIRDREYADAVFEIGGDQVIYIGNLDHHSNLLRAAYNECEVFCLPSMLETPGLAALEAYASGAKVIITKEGSTSEYFNTDVLYVNPTDVDEIALAIESAMKNGRCKIDSLKFCFKWKNQTKRLYEIYKEVLNERDAY